MYTSMAQGVSKFALWQSLFKDTGGHIMYVLPVFCVHEPCSRLYQYVVAVTTDVDLNCNALHEPSTKIYILATFTASALTGNFST